MNKEEAVSRLRAERYAVEPGQRFTVRLMEPEDAWGVARCFFAVYGEHYPFDVYYIPEQLVAANRSGDVYSVIAITAKGDVIGHAALYRSSAYARDVYEYGQATVVPEYRSSFAAFCIQGYILEDLVPQREDMMGLFGEAVCNHVITQKMANLEGFVDTAIEVGLMPSGLYDYPEFPGVRISTVMICRSVRDSRQVVHIPGCYARELEFILSGLDVLRDCVPSVASAPQGSRTELQARFFDQAGVVRCNVPRIGEDFGERVEDTERLAACHGAQVTEVFLNLGEPWCGPAVDAMRGKGFFLGGFLPRWFGTDGLLMQKLAAVPPFESIKLHSERARKILGFIREDILRNPACGVLPRLP